MWKRNLALMALAALCALSAAPVAFAQTDNPPQQVGKQDTVQPPANAPWVKAQAVLDATNADLQRSAFKGLASHVSELEQSLGDGKAAFAPPPAGATTIFVLADGDEETVFLLAQASTSGEKRDVHAVNNPYPQLGFLLGAYYNEIGRFEDAVRALDLGLALDAAPGERLGLERPYLYSERGQALAQMKRLDDALADYDEGLKQQTMEDKPRALLCRGRGFVLTEMNRLDEAEASYNQSLKLEPGNEHALHELKYIAEIRAGLPKTKGALTLAHPPAQQ